MQQTCARILEPMPGRPRDRDLFCERLLAACVRDEGFRALDDARQFAIVCALESGVFNHAIDIADADGVLCSFDVPGFVNRYSIEGFRLLSNIATWMHKIIEGKIDCEKMSYMTNEELNPDANRAERDEIQKRRDQKIDVRASKQYRCRKCQHDEMIPMEYQARALDEAGSISLKCTKCGNVQRR